MVSTATCTDNRAQQILEQNILLSIIVGAIPYPFLSGVALKTLQLRMIYQLSRLYRVKFSENLAKSILLILVAGLASTSIASALSYFIPRTTSMGVATNLFALAMGSGAETFAVGYIMQRHFAAGGTLDNFDVPKSQEYLAQLYEEGKDIAQKLAHEKLSLCTTQ